MEPQVYDEMFATEERHWWFCARRRIVLDLLRRYVPRCNGRRPRLVDLGCGGGANLAAFCADYDAWGTDTIDAAATCAGRRVGQRVCLGRLPDSVPFAPASFDAVVMTDVLEHIVDDRAAASTVIDLLVPGGVFIATVPVGQWLFTHRDTAHHHYRRYSRRGLAALMAGLPARIELLSHCNTFLFPPAAASRLASRVLGSRSTTDLRVPSDPINGMLRSIFASERHLLGRAWLPFGLSLVLVARRLEAQVAPAGANDG